MRVHDFIVEVRTQSARRALESWLDRTCGKTRAERLGPDIVRLPPKVDPRHMSAPELFLDRKTLDGHYRACPRPIGAIEPRVGSRFSRAVTKRVLKRIGRRLEQSGDLDARLVERAWFFPVWSELCLLIPLRHLARHLTRVAARRTIVIPLHTTQLSYLPSWGPNDLEALYLASALHREGARVVLVLVERHHGGAGRFVSLDFRPAALWRGARNAAPPVREVGGTALVLDGIRGSAALVEEHPQSLKVEGAFGPDGIQYDAGFWSDGGAPTAFSVRFPRRVGTAMWSKIRVFSSPTMSLDLIDMLISVMVAPTRNAFAHALALVDTFQLRNVQVCDHLFFHAAVMAHAVAHRSGTIGLWPHSSNVAHPNMYGPGDAASVVCTTRHAALTWAARLPGVPCRIRSELTLQPCQRPRPATNSPPTVVVLGGGHALTRMPILDRHAHEKSYRRLFAALSRLGPSIRVLFKAKTIWETTGWLEEVLGSATPFEETTASPKEIDEPNLIFVTVSLGSTALLEGLGRGIPCMIVREFDVEDYIGLDENYFPIGTVDHIVDTIERCRDNAVLEELCRRQLLWYAQETSFDRNETRNNASTS